MSTIGGITAGGLNLVGSVVGSSSPEAASEQADAASADHKAQTDRDAALNQAPEDVADAQFSSDRDADGRQFYQRAALEQPVAPEADADAEDRAPIPVIRSHATDAFGDRGHALDIEA